VVNINTQKEPSNFVIYLIKNKINNKVYVGQTTMIKSRIYNHIRSFYKDIFDLPLYRAMKKYDIKNFEFSIIDYAINLDDLNKLEIFYIDKYQSNNPEFGYNIANGGKNSNQSKEWVERRIPKAGSEEAKKYGRPKTEEDKKRLSENSPKFWQGKSRSQETKDKISAVKKSTKFTSTKY